MKLVFKHQNLTFKMPPFCVYEIDPRLIKHGQIKVLWNFGMALKDEPQTKKCIFNFLWECWVDWLLVVSIGAFWFFMPFQTMDFSSSISSIDFVPIHCFSANLVVSIGEFWFVMPFQTV